MTKTQPADRYEVRSLVRGLKLLETLEKAGTPLRLTDLADELSMERATLFRYCSTLTRHGYMHLDPATKRYSLGPRVRSLGFAAQQQWEWLDEVRSRLPSLAERFQGAASFAVRDGAEITYIERVVAGRALNYQIELGDRLPAWTTSIGKVLLADLENDEVRSLLAEQAPDADSEALIEELDGIRESGMAFNVGGVTSGLNSVAVPLYLAEESRPVGGLNLAGAARELPLERLRAEVGPALRELALEIMSPAPE